MRVDLVIGSAQLTNLMHSVLIQITPAGDPKQAFLCIFVDFCRFSSTFIKNTTF